MSSLEGSNVIVVMCRVRELSHLFFSFFFSYFFFFFFFFFFLVLKIEKRLGIFLKKNFYF